MLEILYHDKYLVAINKPHGLLVHRTKIAGNATDFALQLLRDQLGIHVYPCHRIDRKTSGVLLFALDKVINSQIQLQYANNLVHKNYLAIVRGYTKQKGIIDYPLKKDDGKWQEAITAYKTVEQVELNIPFSGQPTSRYSLVDIEPQMGRTHQIRRHFAHIFHPVIGDRPHGCNKQNRLFKERWNMTTLMLHANSLSFEHPVSQEQVNIQATLSDEFKRTLSFLGFKSEQF
ncbi:MAG: pseudouridine synthase [Bacteroidales bacterium]